MADCKRKTANLFSDKLIGMTWWDGVITADERFTLYIAEVKPNTEYTASGNNSVDNIMVTYYSVYPAEGQSSVESVRYVYPTNPTRSVATFTTPDDSRIKYAAVRFGSDATEVMFNLGSTAFPYEPNGWVHSLRKLTTATDTITTLPAELYPNAETATVGLKGNMSQTGTPTPTNPIQPSECGERTGNVVAAEDDRTSPMPGLSVVWKKGGSEMIINGKATGGDSARFATVELDAGTYTLSITGLDETGWSKTGFYLSGVDTARVQGVRTYTITEPTSARLQFVVNTSDITYENRKVTIMFTKTSTAKPYEPYGIKIPILSADTTTPIYLGEVQTTRKIKKLVLTGEESTDFYRKNTTSADNSLYYIRFSGLQSVPINGSPLYCTHLPNINYTPSDVVGITVGFNYNVIYFNLGLDVMNAQPSGNTVAGLREYLAAQYAAGTPVTIWYVLANEETGIVNEPLRKIGGYADTVSGITIPTITGKDSFDVLTTLKPSEVDLTYHGWHDISPKSKSANLFDYTTATLGKYIDSNGNEQASSVTDPTRRLNHSDYFHVSPNSTYTFASVKEATVQQTIAFVWYTSEKALISRTTEVISIEATAYSLTATSPNNAEYAIINYITANNEVMLNTGSTALPYEPYWK